MVDLAVDRDKLRNCYRLMLRYVLLLSLVVLDLEAVGMK
jgi:hypothetical protein